MTSPARPASSGFRSPLPPEAPQESALSRLLIAPLTFISFLLSLALIDSRNHSLRTHSHSPSRPPPSSYLGHIKSFLHSLIYKPAASSPYAYIKSPNKEKDGKGNGGKVGKGKEEEPWHWHTKQRHMMKAEMEDAFRLRKWVVLVLLAAGVVAVFGLVAVVRWVQYVWRNWGVIGLPEPLHINWPKTIIHGDIFGRGREV
ncbi:hypothetical protein NA56DRAFT_646954 [Hyaloscypha hepaticicola]|uniref:Uncharacterized protein n=1 Tax=Hyaloscypha hepaticicola TaxID=2082293 RepID=A0A2J6Q014_9HELO|nr:hypothetical protein NA56DRAFT_646954 [Hyaloscypha hepaticicola]